MTTTQMQQRIKELETERDALAASLEKQLAAPMFEVLKGELWVDVASVWQVRVVPPKDEHALAEFHLNGEFVERDALPVVRALADAIRKAKQRVP